VSKRPPGGAAAFALVARLMQHEIRAGRLTVADALQIADLALLGLEEATKGASPDNGIHAERALLQALIDDLREPPIQPAPGARS
jgi:hypothetical protein